VTALLVTGTGTGVGKTVVTAAIAALGVADGKRVTVLKPAQTGEPAGAAGDADEVVRLAGGVRAVELVRYPDALSPEAAARQSGRPALTLDQCVEAVTAASHDADLVLVEGAGGLLVRYDEKGLTMADLAARLALPVVLVTAAGLGTLNATALTVEALRIRGLVLHALVVGAWPATPGLAERCNLRDLPTVAGQQLSGVLPDGASRLTPLAFVGLARQSLGGAFGGDFDPAGIAALAPA
jgi:dethiobiotin synthetase